MQPVHANCLAVATSDGLSVHSGRSKRLLACTASSTGDVVQMHAASSVVLPSRGTVSTSSPWLSGIVEGCPERKPVRTQLDVHKQFERHFRTSLAHLPPPSGSAYDVRLPEQARWRRGWIQPEQRHDMDVKYTYEVRFADEDSSEEWKATKADQSSCNGRSHENCVRKYGVLTLVQNGRDG